MVLLVCHGPLSSGMPVCSSEMAKPMEGKPSRRYFPPLLVACKKKFELLLFFSVLDETL